jgi:F-type H+-transporting ATPase subunit c
VALAFLATPNVVFAQEDEVAPAETEPAAAAESSLLLGGAGGTAGQASSGTPAAAGSSLLFGSAFATGLIIIGAGLGIGRIGGSAVESMSRQPEVAGNIQTAMIISAALIEGATFFALIVCLLEFLL